MDSITEVFLEDWNDAEQARQKRDARVAELEQQGFRSTVGLFYNALTGKRIYLLEATQSLTSDSEPPPQSPPQRPRSSRPQRPRSPRSTPQKL